MSGCGPPETGVNYFNYFTEIEGYFWKKRGAHLLVSPVDWAIVETWQKAGIPLEAVLTGIDRAFESYARSRRGQAGRQMKSLAYCVDAVVDAAEEMREAAAGKGPESGRRAKSPDPFSREELHNYFARNAEKLRTAAQRVRGRIRESIEETGKRIEEMAVLLEAPGRLDLEDLERRLTVQEEKLNAALTAAAAEEVLLGIRREMDTALAPYRRKMTAEQLNVLERQLTQKRLLEHYGVPRLSLFYFC